MPLPLRRPPARSRAAHASASEPPVVDRKRDIIVAACTVFIDEGYSAFSMRKVAKQVGVSLGHLQHFFPTKDGLLLEMLQFTASGYMRAYERVSQSAPSDPRKRFELIVTYLLDDIANAAVTSFFLELWPVTVRNPAARDMLRSMYQQNLDVLTSLVKDIRPDLEPARAEQKTLEVIAIVDGLLIFHHSIAPSAARFKKIKRNAFATIVNLIDVPTTNVEKISSRSIHGAFE